MDDPKTTALFGTNDPQTIQMHLLSTDEAMRKAAARELLSQVKLKVEIRDLGYLLPILLSITDSEDPEVIEFTARCFARFSTEAWSDYVEHYPPQETNRVLLKLLQRKHQGIRAAVAQALVATALHTQNAEFSHPLWEHPSPKVQAAAVSALSSCLEAGIAINPMIPILLSLLPGAHKRVANAIAQTLQTWLGRSAPTREHFKLLESTHQELSGMVGSHAKQLASAISSHLENNVSAYDIEKLFGQLKSANQKKRRDAIAKMFPLFDRGAIVPEDVAFQIKRSLAHQDPEVREGIARIVTNAQWRRGEDLTLLNHTDGAVKQGAQTVERVRGLVGRTLTSPITVPTSSAPAPSTSAPSPRTETAHFDPEQEVDPMIKQLVTELFDDTMKNQWGWGQCFEPGWRTQPGALTSKVVARLSCGSLRVAYFCLSSITIDLQKRTVVCFAADQKTPADQEWELRPSTDWWTRAQAIAVWPVGKRLSEMGTNE